MYRSLFVGLACLGTSTAMAQEAPVPDLNGVKVTLEPPTPEVVVGLGLSTLGANIEAAYRINPTYQVRGVVMGGVNVDYEESDEDGEFSGNLTLGGVAVMGDFYPLQSGWRISGGLFLSNAELSASGTTDVQGATDVDAEVEARFASDIAPMLTTGYDLGFGRGWSLSTEAGVIFTGGVDVIYTADDTALQDELDNDPDLQDIVEDARDVPVYPYASVTVSFKF